MRDAVLIAGHGGQGVLFAGKVLAQAALDAGLEATFFPSYGAEIRGGTAHCTVIIADAPIGSPVVCRWDSQVLLNRPSFDKYYPLRAPGALVIINSSLVSDGCDAADRAHCCLPVTELSLQRFDSARFANTIALGAFACCRGYLNQQVLEQALDRLLAGKQALAEQNLTALTVGRRAYEHQKSTC